MIAILLSPFYILFNIYIVRWLLCWMGACHKLFQKRWVKGVMIGIYIFLASSILTAFLLPASPVQRLMKLISNYWLGTLLYMIMAVVTADGIRHILLHLKFREGRVSNRKLAAAEAGREEPFNYYDKFFGRRGLVVGGSLSIAVIAVFTAVGIAGAAYTQVTDYELAIDKECGGLTSMQVVLVADLHLGYSIGTWHMEKMVEKINAQNPDLVVIAGDIFDNEYDALDDPERLAEILSGIHTRYGVYACYGNHDIQERLLAGFTLGGRKEEKASDPRMDEFLNQAGIVLLHEEGVLIDHAFYLYGRPDYKKPGREIARRRTPDEITAGMDLDKPVIVIDHEPKELKELADAGVDLDLCGHTHDGQMFPGNLVTALMWENSCGYLQKGGMHNIVTSGVGVFGPNMRVGTKSEICSITIRFTDSE